MTRAPRRARGAAPLRPVLLVASGVLVASLVAACGSGGTGPSADPAGAGGEVELTVFGAASLADALDAVAADYAVASPGTTLTLSTGSSAALATQIEQGAPADVFLSADATNPRRLADGGLADGEPVAFASNALAIVVPSGNPAAIATPADLARPGLRIVAAGPAVPITVYAERLVDNLAATPGYPAGFAGAYEANVVSREDDVRAVVAKVELGEGDAGIVYATDARAAGGVETVAIPPAANVAAAYAGVVLAGSSRPAAARAFLDWLLGPGGRAVLGRFGFGPPVG